MSSTVLSFGYTSTNFKGEEVFCVYNFASTDCIHIKIDHYKSEHFYSRLLLKLCNNPTPLSHGMCIFLIWFANLLLSWIFDLVSYFLKGEFCAKTVHSPVLYQVYLLLKREDLRLGKEYKIICKYLMSFIFSNIF